MGRPARLRKKNGHWYTEAGGQPVYLGRADEYSIAVSGPREPIISRAEAQRRFLARLQEVAAPRPATGDHSVAVLCDRFLTAVKERLSISSYDERKRHLERFCNHMRDGVLIADMLAVGIRATDLTSFLDEVQTGEELDPFTTGKHLTSIVACFHWGAGVARLKNPSPCLPPGFRPFGGIERYKSPANALHEDELPTADEIARLFKWADTDIESPYENGRWRARRPEERRSGKENPYVGFEDILRVYHATGARTSELADASVRDVVNKAIVLIKHKRSKTMRQPAPRTIPLNGTALQIIQRVCKGRKPTDPIFTDPKGRRWTRQRIDKRLEQVRALAGVRDEITPYSFRHLWISRALMAGIDMATVARMAGTSVGVIERTYAHFRSDHFQDALKRLDEAESRAVVA